METAAPDTKVCIHCQQEKPLSEMVPEKRKDRGGRIYYRNRCRDCASKIRRTHRRKNLITDADRSARYRQKNPNWAILKDSRRSDKRRGRENNLTREFIAEQIVEKCSYCGDSAPNIKMTLDRIDNDKGHTQDNVVPACIRCNYTRKNMPYEAWLVVAKGMREAHEKGLFNKWTGRARAPIKR